MQLNSKEIIEKGIIINYDQENAIQQQGIDLRIADLYRLTGTGIIPKTGKTVLPTRQKIVSFNDYWDLNPGYYEVYYCEGCEIPNNISMRIVSRSSLLRCGAIVISGQFDAGFSTDQIGSFIDIKRPIRIYKNARIAQAICFNTEIVPIESLYNGQYQHK